MTEQQIVAIRKHREEHLAEIQQELIAHWKQLQSYGRESHMLHAGTLVEIGFDIERMESVINSIAELSAVPASSSTNTHLPIFDAPAQQS